MNSHQRRVARRASERAYTVTIIHDEAHSIPMTPAEKRAYIDTALTNMGLVSLTDMHKPLPLGFVNDPPIESVVYEWRTKTAQEILDDIQAICNPQIATGAALDALYNIPLRPFGMTDDEVRRRYTEPRREPRDYTCGECGGKGGESRWAVDGRQISSVCGRCQGTGRDYSPE